MDGRYKLLFFLALVINYTADLTLIAVWGDPVLGYIISMIIGFSFGLVVKKTEDFLVLMMLSYIVASFMAILVFISPALHSDVVWVQVEIGVLGGAGIVIYNSIFIVPLSMLAGLVGLYISDRYFRSSKVPSFVESWSV